MARQDDTHTYSGRDLVCADATGDTGPEQVQSVDGVVVAPTVRQALEACREHRYTS
jgi:hypothetical protein